MTHPFRLGGYNIVLDTASGSIHSVDDVAFDAICEYDLNGKSAAIKTVMEKYGNIGKDEILDLFSDIEELVQRGKLFTDDAQRKKNGLLLNRPVKALCMNVSHVCNMRCSYCFAGDGGYGRDCSLMPLDVGKRAIDFLLENSGSRKNLDVDFFGGEPLLNMETIKGIVKHAREREQSSGKKFRFTLTTNGLLIDDDVIEYTNLEMHNIVLSLDGRPEIHDAMRKLPDGGGSYAQALPLIKKIVSERNNADYHIRGTFTRNNLDFVKDILHIANLGFRELAIEPVVAKKGDARALTMADLPILSEQYEQLAAEMLMRNREGRGFEFYHFKLDLKNSPCLYKRSSGCGVGSEYLAVTPSGELYPCHRFVGDSSFILGNVWNGVTNFNLANSFNERVSNTSEKCEKCWARLFCSGGCAANAYYDTGAVNGIYELGCEMTKKRTECAIMLKVAEAI